MNAGDLDERIAILDRTTVIDGYGAERETWATLIQPWAERRDVGAREVMRNPQIVGEIDVVWKIRHPGVSLNSTMRVQDAAGRLYEIRGINPLPGRREGFEIQARSLDKTGATAA